MPDILDNLLSREAIAGAFERLSAQERERINLAFASFFYRNGLSHEDGSMGGVRISPQQMRDLLSVFAERIRQDEREKCACIVEDEAVDWEATRSPEDAAYNNAIDHCADAIRSSGTSQSNPLLGGGNG